MSARVKIESNRRTSSVISQQQQTLEGAAAGVEGAGGTASAVLPGGHQRPASRSVDDTRQTGREGGADTPKGKQRANVQDAAGLPSVSSAQQATNATQSGDNVEAAAQPDASAGPGVIQDLTGGTVGTVSSKSMRDVAATRESPRIRRANEANTVNIEVETANTIIAAAVNDSVNAYFKSKAFSKLLSTVVKGQPFEGAVLQLNKKLPANKAQLKKAVADNSAGVRSIIQASLKPQLDKATKDFKLAADTAVKVMKTAVLAMGVATAELKEASTGAEAIADTPVEAKGGGQKARGKKAVQFVSLDKSSEEEALLPGAAQEKLAGVMNDNFADTLSAKVDPCFQQLNVTIISGLQQSVQLIGQRASADNVVLQKQMEVVAAGLSSLELTVTEHFGVLGGSCDKSRRELRQIAKTCADSGTGKYKRQRTANTSSSSTPAAKQKSKRAAHPPPSPPSSMSYDNWSSESSVEPPTPPPEPKKRGKPGRTPSRATSAKPLSSIYSNTASMVQLQQEIAPAFQPQQPQQGQQPQHQQSQQPQHQQILQPQHQQSQQPPAPHQQQHHRMGQMGVAHPAPIGHWNNIGIPALPPQAQTAINSPPAPHSYPYLALQG